MQFTLVNFWVYKLSNHDVWAVGKLGLWEAIPAICFSLFSGHFVDQLEKRKVLLWCAVGYILVSLTYVYLALPQTALFWNSPTILTLIYLCTFLGGILRSFLSPSSFALMGMILPRSHYQNGGTWSSTAWQLGAVLGPLFAGFLIGLDTFSSGLWIVVLMQIITLVAVFAIPAYPILKKEKEAILIGLKKGLVFVFKTPVILGALSLDLFAVLFGGAIALLPAYKEDILHLTGLEYGWLQAVSGVGTIVTLFLLSLFPVKKNPGVKLLIGIAAFGIATIGFGLATSFWMAATMLFLTGVFDGISVVMRSTILQLMTPDEMRGRVAAVNTMFISSSNEIGRAESGITARWMGIVPAVVFGGAMTVFVVVIMIFVAPALRNYQFEKVKNKTE